MPSLVAIHEYKSVTFNIYQDWSDPEDGPVETYFFWERDDIPEGQPGHSPIIIMDSVEEARIDAENEVDGNNVVQREHVEYWLNIMARKQ